VAREWADQGLNGVSVEHHGDMWTRGRVSVHLLEKDNVHDSDGGDVTRAMKAVGYLEEWWRLLLTIWLCAVILVPPPFFFAIGSFPHLSVHTRCKMYSTKCSRKIPGPWFWNSANQLTNPVGTPELYSVLDAWGYRGRGLEWGRARRYQGR
jgi:hypothetical protein